MASWPTGPIEYGSFAWLRREVSMRIGLPPDARLLDHVDRSRVDSIIESGLRLFYHPNPSMFTVADATEAQKERLRRAPHQWTFLQETTSITTVPAQSEYDLPANFSSFIDEPTTDRSGERIAIASASHIRQLLASSPMPGAPKYAAVETKTATGAARQGSILLLYPTPAEAETIKVRHGVVPATLSMSLQYPHGGTEHAETILACCCFVAAERNGGDLEVARQLMADRMAASILQDVHAAQPSSEGVWPVDEPDNGLAVNRQYLGRLVGREMGFGPNRHVWTHQQSSLVTEAIKQGLRRFYNPPTLPGDRYPWNWSFLLPLAELTTVADQAEYILPAGFTMLEGGMTYVDASLIHAPLIRRAGEELVRHRIQQTDLLVGRPEMVAIRLSGEGPHYEAVFWPVPDDEYVLQYRYRLNPLMIAMNEGDEVPGVSGPSSQPGGAQVHSQTIIESCLLACDELMKRDTRPRMDSFYRCLVASVGFDQKLSSPATMGYNADHGARRRRIDYRDFQTNLITYTPRA